LRHANNSCRPFFFSQIILTAGILIVPFLAGCVAPKQVRDFTETARSHPDQAVVIEGVPAFSATKPHADFAPLAAVLQYWKQSVSAGDVEQWYANHSVGLASEDRPVRCAWEHGLWAFGQHGSPDALKTRLRAGVPVIVILQANALDEATRRFAVVIGYDDLEKRVLYHAGGQQPAIAAYSDFFSAWRSTFNWMLTVCPADRIAWTPDPAEVAGRGQFNEANGRLEQAIADYEAAIASGMRRSSLLVRLGNCYRSRGNPEKAETAYREALSLDDHNGRAYNNLAYLLAENSKSLDEAVSLARQAMLLEPTNPLAIDTLGFALFQQGKYKEASDVLDRARARARWSPPGTQTEIGLHLAWAHVKAGNPHLAKEVLADILKIDPKAQIPPDLRKLGGAE
jgi:tetratricopeptide (TPR) repeat protein